MNFHAFVEILISGITIGMIYFLIAVGFSLIYGISRVLNLAYGSLYIHGAYFAWIFTSGYFHLNWLFVFLIVIAIMFVVGVLMEIIIVKPLRNEPNFDFSLLLATLGVAMVLDNAALILYGPRTKSLPPLFDGRLELFGFVISFQQIAMLVISIILSISLGLFLKNSIQGKKMRAVAQDPIGAQICGVNMYKIYAFTFGLSTVLVGAAGILLAPRFFITPLGGWPILIKALIIVIAGGLGSIKGTLYSAFILGILEAFAGYTFGMLWVMPFWFLVVLLILAFKPLGLFGTASH